MAGGGWWKISTPPPPPQKEAKRKQKHAKINKLIQSTKNSPAKLNSALKKITQIQYFFSVPPCFWCHCQNLGANEIRNTQRQNQYSAKH